MKNSPDSLARARDYAFLLLKFRQRSEQEIREKLKRKKFSPEIIRETVIFLKEKAFLDDQIFAREWISSRLKRPLGIRRIRQELKLKGVPDKIIQSEIEQAGQDYREEAVVEAIAQEKAQRLKGLDPQKAKRRIYGYLLRRGFSPDSVSEAVLRLNL
ncbi:MAG: regulatory protein RecX [Candidatus Omnitrophota bacterium]|nr:regulatory protein RecX [Candidatus Omnitrophota bacterium]